MLAVNILTPSRARPIEAQLAGFEPDFEFVPPPPLPLEEFEPLVRSFFDKEPAHENLTAGDCL